MAGSRFLPFLIFLRVILDARNLLFFFFTESHRSWDEATGSSAVAILTRNTEEKV